MSISIRDARDDDLPGILAIYNDAVLHSTALWIETLADLANRRAWLSEREAAGFPVLVAQDSNGEVLGCRLGLTAAVSLSAAISIPLAPLIVGLSSLGVAACGVALLAICMAKVNVRVSEDWKGNISKPMPRYVFGKVTPT